MEEIDLKELFEMFWNKKILIIVMVIFFGIAGVVYTKYFTTPMYKSYTTLVLTKADSPSGTSGTTSEMITASDVTLNSKLVATYGKIATSKTVIRTVISNLGLDISENRVKKNVSVSTASDTEMLEITVKNEDPEIAADLANEIAKVFTDTVKEVYNISNVAIIDKAEKESKPCNINHSKDVIIFAFVGLVLSMGYVFILNMLDTTLKSREEIEKIANIPVLVSIPTNEFGEEIAAKKKNGGKK